MRRFFKIVLVFVVFGWRHSASAQFWPHDPSATLLSKRFQPPPGYHRLSLSPHSFGAWLQNLPLKAGCPPVHLFNGELKNRQDVHCAVVDLDVGNADLQQCSKAVIRLRSEYLWEAKRLGEIRFLLVNGEWMDWISWEKGKRPVERDDEIQWVQKAKEDGSYPNFEKFLRSVFVWANTMSLSRQLSLVKDPGEIVPGDVFIQGGFPGHVVLVVDVAENEKGQRVFLLGQSYMPAQEFHILKNLQNPFNPWYIADGRGQLATPEWIFDWSQLKRFPKP